MKNCECTFDAVEHKADKCPNPATRKVERDEQEIYVCSDCYLISDKELSEE